MSPKLFAFLTWIFYLAERRTADELWLICMIYSAILAVCALFYRRENKVATAKKKKK
ncbi:hypothetical protein [Desulfatitalea alkaliphila]|uniref:Uncharacterized protein n=1 Tax=Desulfatitalea alkaliphila TaxID=2929485 RepID=A0AA41UIM5_9BACT|nr:hypothetical protein [Desulfatitalea alkaliphila]MCJ8499707.1 hypothetical protein [Desulfatitalea alkaliphila]